MSLASAQTKTVRRPAALTERTISAAAHPAEIPATASAVVRRPGAGNVSAGEKTWGKAVEAMVIREFEPIERRK